LSSNLVVQRDGAQTGELNMAIDQRLLEEAGRSDQVVLRIYRWSEPTLSLGHFQNSKDIPTQAPWGCLPQVVRRTGGGAIVHHHELTYCLVVPHSCQEPGKQKGHSEHLYRVVHDALASSLRDLEWNAQRSEDCTCRVSSIQSGDSQHSLSKEPKTSPFLCFERRSPVDIVVQQHKVIGSAQRRGPGGLLQHGSILLRASPSAPQLLGLLDFPPRKHSSAHADCDAIDWDFWTEWLVVAVKQALETGIPGLARSHH
jgi:lipoate-protein ligase A